MDNYFTNWLDTFAAAETYDFRSDTFTWPGLLEHMRTYTKRRSPEGQCALQGQAFPCTGTTGDGSGTDESGGTGSDASETSGEASGSGATTGSGGSSDTSRTVDGIN